MNAMDQLILSIFLGGSILLFMMSHTWRRESPILMIWACRAMTLTTRRSKQWPFNDFIFLSSFFHLSCDVPCFLVLGEFLKTKPTIDSPESQLLPFDVVNK